MDYVHAHTPAEIAQVIKPQFDDTDMETLTAIVKRYQEQDTWKDSLIFEKDSFLLLSDILESAGDRKSTRLNSSHRSQSRMPSSA